MMKIRLLLIAISAGLVTYFWLFKDTNMCKLSATRYFAIDSVKYGLFSEFIPQSGVVAQDTLAHTSMVKVMIDELYLPRIVNGLKATTQINNMDYALEITHVYPEVIDGRFTVDMTFNEKTPAAVVNGSRLRLRLELSEPSHVVLIPVGGFYKDTGGKWIFLVEEGIRVVRRDIKLGRKNSDYFEVLEGLKPGDQVITSSYEEFKDEEAPDLDEIRKRFSALND